MKKYTVLFSVCLTVCLLVIFSYAAAAIGGIDDFEDNTTQSWARGTNITTGGPTGAGDNFLQLIADGMGANGKLVTFNQTQWAGDYSAVNAGNIRLDAICNSCPSDLTLRLVLGDTASPSMGSGTWYASTVPFTLLDNGMWQSHIFSLAEADMTLVQGAVTYNSVFANVVTLRILHSASAAANGDDIVATIGLDNIGPQTPTVLTLSQSNIHSATTDPLIWITMIMLGTVTLFAWQRQRRRLVITSLTKHPPLTQTNEQL